MSTETAGSPAPLHEALARELPYAAAFVVDRDLRYLLADGQSLLDAGYDRSQFLGRAVDEMVPPEMVEHARSDYLAALGGGTFRTEHSVGVRHFVTHGVPLRAADRSVYAALAVSFDITEYKEAERALREVDKRKDAFLATLAHELRNPLAPLDLGVALLRRLPRDSVQGERTLDMMDKQIRQIVRLVEDLVDLARVTEGKLEIKPKTVSVAELFEMAVEATEPIFLANGHALSLVVPDAHPLLIRVDPERVAQVLINLLNNAAKFTPRGGEVELKAAQRGDWIVFSVRDNGPGIAAEKLDSVFEMFTQLGHELTPGAQGGLGIGLALVKKLVELHGGSVGAQSDGPGQGSTFEVLLPKSAP